MHIELWNKMPQLPVTAKYLFLAGDICSLSNELFYKFFDYCSSNWEKTFYIPGNHEFYSKKRNYNELDFEYKLKLSEKYKNVFYLNDDFVQLNENVNVYGSIFWTKSPFKTTREARLYINDYNWISYYNKPRSRVVNLDILYVNELSKISHNKLQKYLNDNKEKLTIIMTHFPPLRTGAVNPKYLTTNTLQDLYFTWPDKTVEDFNLTNVPLWLSGHTHWSYNFNINGCQFISNQVGYSNEIFKTGLNEDGTYEIEIDF
jgi:predicted phosphohydrolase